MNTEPEYITIVEGPTPEFHPSPDLALNSVLEGPYNALTVCCEMRTMNGQDILARCQHAWQEGRPVRLDYPDEMRMRQEIDVAAVRLKEIEEGMVLQVWVYQSMDLIEQNEDDDAPQ